MFSVVPNLVTVGVSRSEPPDPATSPSPWLDSLSTTKLLQFLPEPPHPFDPPDPCASTIPYRTTDSIQIVSHLPPLASLFWTSLFHVSGDRCLAIYKASDVVIVDVALHNLSSFTGDVVGTFRFIFLFHGENYCTCSLLFQRELQSPIFLLHGETHLLFYGKPIFLLYGEISFLLYGEIQITKFLLYGVSLTKLSLDSHGVNRASNN
ncbi:unnamed protein product [Arabis nemorensis]|uniref:Uncharacterized protein n=1 Tax=Arabis nemorensis TaxID=586526 RepID=A0A565ATF0_9BRAS|nr:unnamed protein product [Arabis nemorensis]